MARTDFSATARVALANNGWTLSSDRCAVRHYAGGIVAVFTADGAWTVRGPGRDARAHGQDIPREAWGAMDANEAAWRQPEYRAYWDCFHAQRECIEAWERAAREAV